MKILPDTNILGRLANRSDPQQKLAENAVTLFRTAGYRPCIVPQNIYEFWSVATRPKQQNGLGMSPGEVVVAILQFKSFFDFQEDIPAIYPEWEKLAARYSVVGKNAHDARLVAAMVVHGVKDLLTFNLQDFRRYAEIRSISPEDAAKLPGATP